MLEGIPLWMFILCTYNLVEAEFIRESVACGSGVQRNVEKEVRRSTSLCK